MNEELQVKSNERTGKLLKRAKDLGKAGLVLVAGTVTAVSLFGGGAEAGNQQPKDTPTHESPQIPTYEVTAIPGDTLWSITSDVKNVKDRRDVIDWVEKSSPDVANDGSLDVGDVAIVPVNAEDIK